MRKRKEDIAKNVLVSITVAGFNPHVFLFYVCLSDPLAACLTFGNKKLFQSTGEPQLASPSGYVYLNLR